MDFYNYYLNQADRNYFRGTPYQRGYGLGGAFKSFFRWILPLIKPIAQNVGRDLIHTNHTC